MSKVNKYWITYQQNVPKQFILIQFDIGGQNTECWSEIKTIDSKEAQQCGITKRFGPPFWFLNHFISDKGGAHKRTFIFTAWKIML